MQKTKLQNGLTIVSEKIPTYRSVAIGVWIKAGSRYESHLQKGLAHFIEHMVFKGTKSRTALEIASLLEKYGGQLNAFTGKEETCFYLHTIDSHLDEGVEILADMVCNPSFTENDIKLERQVVLEEISAVYDAPEEYIFDLFQEKIFADQPMGYPILGDRESVKKFNRNSVKEFWKEYYQPSNIILSVTGNVDHNTLTDMAEKYFVFDSETSIKSCEKASPLERNFFVLNRPVAQTHICMGNKSASYYDENRYDFMAISTYLGEGLSSRLFQVLREKYGYAYSVYSFLDFYMDTGVLGFYIGTDPSNKNKAMEVLFAEFEKFRARMPEQEVINMIKDQLIGRFLLSLESTYKRMVRLAKNEMYFGKYIDSEAVIHSIEKISAQSVFNAAQTFFDRDKFTTVVITPGKN
ncbi:MAG: insulinase family protein [Calditrichae bacterium]|nr:insulinase family protein [Calditrichia bacterium]